MKEDRKVRRGGEKEGWGKRGESEIWTEEEREQREERKKKRGWRKRRGDRE